eukprot:GSMAST32.ASY1.ANO1.1193.1 assembled CDS
MTMKNSNSRSKFDYLVKLLLIGDSGVGKSCVLLRYCDGKFTTNFITTIGIDFKIKTVTVGDKVLKLQVWDTAGQERFKTICTAYYRGAQGICTSWMKQITKNAPINVVQVLLANKCDIPNSKCDIEEGRALAESSNIPFFATSAKSGIGIEEAFLKMAELSLKNLEMEALAEKSKYQMYTGDKKVSLTGDVGESNLKKKCC